MKLNKNLLLLSLAVAIGFGVYYSYPSFAVGNVSEFNSPCTLSGTPASTSPVYMIAGKATTTISCGLASSSGTAANGASMNFFFTASSSPLSTAVIVYQWSNDNFNNTFEDRVINGAATSTQIIGSQRLYVYNESATTTDVINGGTIATSSGSFIIPNPQRAKYLKAVIYASVGSSPFAIWAEIVPTKERSN